MAATDWWHRAMDIVTSPSGCLGVGAAAAVGVASLAYLMTRPVPPKLSIDFNKQAVRLENGSYADPWTLKHGHLIEKYYDDVSTVYEAFLRGKRITGDGDCLGARTGPNKEYEWLSYNQVYEKMQAFGSGLFQMGLQPGQKTHLGIMSLNRPEWVIADQACQMYSMVTIALYTTLGDEGVVHIVNLCDISTVVCDTDTSFKLLMENKSKMKSLKNIVMIEEVTEEMRKEASRVGLKIVHFSDVEKLGREKLRDPEPPKPNDLSTIVFTSGTTGEPKGATITHGNFIADLSAIYLRLEDLIKFSKSDCHLSYLPLAHNYERLNLVSLFTHGAHGGFYSRNILLLFDDLQTLKPTSFPTVPRILNKIRDKVLSGAAASPVKNFLLHQALSSKEAELKRGIVRRDSVWDKLVLHKIQALLGGRIRSISVGSAPLSAEVMQFTRCALGCLVYEGWGLTESCAAATLQHSGDFTTGHTGSPLACNYVKVIDVPEMELFAKDGIGEVCVKGTNVMGGYYRNVPKTLEAFTEDGWLRTGDVGRFNENGTLQIVDRCKHIFKLQQGEYIAPEKIETIYTRSKYVQQCFVDGDSLKTHVVAVVVPDPDFVVPLAASKGKVKDIKVLCQDEELRAAILQDMLESGKSAKLKGFEQALDIYLEPEPFTTESGMLTPTFKNKRPQLRRRYAHQVAALYAKHKI